MERFAYIKYSDVAAEVRAFCTRKTPDVSNGPMNYIFNFLKWAQNNETIIISFESESDGNKTFKNNNVTAKAFKNRSKKKYWHFKVGGLIQFGFEIICVFKLLRAFKPTWILCSRIKGALIGSYLYARFYRVRLVVSRHGSIDIGNKKNVVKLISKLNYYITRRAAAILCHGPYLRDQLLAQNVERNKIFEFNLSYQSLLTQKGSDNPTEGRTILYVGRITESKGALDLFHASSRLLHQNDDLRLAYAGNGECLNKLKELAIANNIEDKVVLYGYVEHDNIRKIMENCSFLVMPTKAISDEGRPKSAIEALSFGKPVIAPDLGSFRYLIKDGYNGLLYEPDNIDDLCAKIKILLEAKEIYEALKIGAKQSSKKLLTPELSFTGALQKSYALSYR